MHLRTIFDPFSLLSCLLKLRLKYYRYAILILLPCGCDVIKGRLIILNPFCLKIKASFCHFSLGMNHDGETKEGNFCNPDLYLMSPVLGPGKVTWSTCSNRELSQFMATHPQVSILPINSIKNFRHFNL